jgi:hypothetical protein
MQQGATANSATRDCGTSASKIGPQQRGKKRFGREDYKKVFA